MSALHHNLGDHVSPPPGQPRVKQSRPLSPGPSTSDPLSSDSRPPAQKRARKAINCEPCRNSKLKCDRNRPCSSCVLRGTTASCYQNHDSDVGGRDDQQARIDPAAEFLRIRHSLNLLETHISQQSARNGIPPAAPVTSPTVTPRSVTRPSTSSGSQVNGAPKPPPDAPHEPSPEQHAKPSNIPGMLGQSDPSGFYAGPTSALSHLIAASREEGDRAEPSSGSDALPSTLRNSASMTPVAYQSYDDDLVKVLQPLHAIDGLVDYYFEYCNWIYRHVNQTAFMRNWQRFKAGNGGDRVTLGTVCIIVLLAVRYLPPGHMLLSSLSWSTGELEGQFYNVMREALQRHFNDLRRDGLGKGYTLDLIELLLIRSHYLTFGKEDPEETWAVKGELVNIGTAMGLHKDPGDTKFTREEAERRRWAWWHIILLERWQAFMFGRPIAIASNHFNTRLPSYCDPAIDPTGRLYLPNLALFKLAFALGYIMEDAVSFQPVSYTSIQEHDRRLTKWYEELPRELEMDDFQVSRSLSSPVTSVRRIGVQSVIIRTAYYHIRFTLHRPYSNTAASLNIAVNAASQIINLVAQTRSGFVTNTALAVPGHMNWGPFHVFSAAMFFSFQLITHPDQPAAVHFRDNIKKAIVGLEQTRWMPVADKALTILQALAPLYSDDFPLEPPQEQKRKKAQVLKLVKTLAFPYQDAPIPKGDSSAGSSPAVGTQPASSPRTSQIFGPPHKHTQTQIPVSSLRWSAPESASTSQHPPLHQPQPQPLQQPPPPPPPPQQQQQPHHTYAEQPPVPPPHLSPPVASSSAMPQMHPVQQQMPPQYHQHPAVYAVPAVPPQHAAMHDAFYMQQALPDDSWGASVGFGLSEWTQFLDVMQRPSVKQ